VPRPAACRRLRHAHPPSCVQSRILRQAGGRISQEPIPLFDRMRPSLRPDLAAGALRAGVVEDAACGTAGGGATYLRISVSPYLRISVSPYLRISVSPYLRI